MTSQGQKAVPQTAGQCFVMKRVAERLGNSTIGTYRWILWHPPLRPGLYMREKQLLLFSEPVRIRS